MDNTQDRISKLLSDPENIKTIAQIASGFMPSGGEGVSEGALGEESSDKLAVVPDSMSGEEAEAVSASANEGQKVTSDSTMSGLFGDIITPEKVDKGIGFLGALKPYLGSHKKEVCEVMIKVLGAAKLLTIYKN